MTRLFLPDARGITSGHVLWRSVLQQRSRADRRKKAMAISIVLLLGLAITFYGYVSIHWFAE